MISKSAGIPRVLTIDLLALIDIVFGLINYGNYNLFRLRNNGNIGRKQSKVISELTDLLLEKTQSLITIDNIMTDAILLTYTYKYLYTEYSFYYFQLCSEF